MLAASLPHDELLRPQLAPASMIVELAEQAEARHSVT